MGAGASEAPVLVLEAVECGRRAKICLARFILRHAVAAVSSIFFIFSLPGESSLPESAVKCVGESTADHWNNMWRDNPEIVGVVPAFRVVRARASDGTAESTHGLTTGPLALWQWCLFGTNITMIGTGRRLLQNKPYQAAHNASCAFIVSNKYLKFGNFRQYA